MHPWEFYEYSYQEFAWKLAGFYQHRDELLKAQHNSDRWIAYFIAPNDKNTAKLPIDKRIPSMYDRPKEKTEKDLNALRRRGLERSRQLDEKRKQKNAGQKISDRGRDRSNGNRGA